MIRLSLACARNEICTTMVVIDLDQRAAASPSLGTPVGCFLTGGEPHDLVGADHLLPTMQADRAGKTAVIPPRTNRSSLCDYSRQLYGAR
jgi:hypothetical protein